MDKWLVSIVAGGKVVELYYSDDLVDIGTIRAIHKDHEVEAVKIGTVIDELPSPSVIKPSKRKTNRRVRCKETGAVYTNVNACSLSTGICVKSIYESIRRGILAKGFTFEYVD